MTPLEIILSYVFAIVIPAIFLVVIYALDMYASRTFGLVLICFAWGGIGGLVLAYAFNMYVALPLIFSRGLDIAWLFVAFAPFAEEIVKSMAFLYIVRRPEFTYFVDGAIYGFAAGIGFSIAENIFYIIQYPTSGVALPLVRSFSVCLMHGTASALVGAAIGRARFRKRTGRGLALLSGWGAAILIHGLFNSVAKTDWFRSLAGEGLVVPLQVVLGLAGVGVIAYFITQGLREQRQWFAQTLNREVGVTGAEVRAAQAYASIDEVLKPITEQFPRQAEQVESLLLHQAQLGIKRKVYQQLEDANLKREVGEDIEQLQADMEQLRREIGPYVMAFVRAVFPEGMLDLWGRMESLALRSGPPDVKRWAEMLEREREEEKGPPQRDIFSRLQQV